MASHRCNSGDVFSKHLDCVNVCTGPIDADNVSRAIFPDKVEFKVMDFYPDEYALSSGGNLLLSSAYEFTSYVNRNFGVTVCLPMDDCFSSHKYWLVQKENLHSLDHNRQLWVKPIRQIASYGKFYLKDNYAVVCHPKLSDTPLRIYNGILCIMSVLLLCRLLMHLKLKLKKPEVVSVFPATLFFGYIFQTLNYLWMCPKPLLFILEKYCFISAFLWITFQALKLYKNLRFTSTTKCRVSNKYLPFLFSLLPICVERLYSSYTVDFFSDSCDFLLTNGQYLNSILDTVIFSVIILNSFVLRFVKSELEQKRTQDSALFEQFYLYVHLTIVGAVYISIKLVTDIIAIEEVNSNWFYLDMLCQAFGGAVIVVYYKRLITS
uniref:Uncharacterized protein n=1 Tax=Strigamia maritima TaxID=126957 RepID=T1ISG5_STRMM